MASQQLRLFNRPKPLVERFGAQFFRNVPRTPGVYLMYDGSGSDRPVYVGKAKDLRQRLGSYRCISERTARRTIRLLHTVTAIRWELCETEEHALLRENALLHEHRPKFNRANTWPRAYPFIELSADERHVRLRLTQEATPHCYGAFKGNARAGYAALLRLTYAAAGCDYGDLPRPLVLPRAPAEWITERSRVDVEGVHQFLSGNSDILLHRCAAVTTARSAFYEQFRQSDLETLAIFFVRGPSRNRRWLKRIGSEQYVIAPERLDDVAVMTRAPDNYAAPIAS